MLRLELLLLLLVAVCFRVGDAHTRLVVGRHQQRHLVGQVMRHESLVFRVLSFDGFLHRTPRVKVGDSVGSGGHGAVYSVEILKDDKVHDLKERDQVVVKAGCSCPGSVDLVWEHQFHQRAFARCPNVTPKLYGPVVTLSENDSKELKALKSCDKGCTQQLLFMEKMDDTLKLDYVKPLLQDKAAFLHKFALPLLEGLECYHEANIFHHDIKRQNMLVRYPNKFKFGDFGMSMNVTLPLEQEDWNIGLHNLPVIFGGIQLKHATPGLTSVLALTADASVDYYSAETVLKVPKGTEKEPTIPVSVQEVRRNIDAAALALVIRSAYTQESPAMCFLSFHPCSPAKSDRSGGWGRRQSGWLDKYKMKPAGVQIPVLEKVLDDLMANYVSISKAVKLLKEEFANDLLTSLGRRQKMKSAERH